jgi:hypothetical protein
MVEQAQTQQIAEVGGVWFDPLAVDADTVPMIVPYRGRVSARAALSLVLGVLALAATFTGLLAYAGVILGVAAVVVAVFGLVGARQRRLTGQSLALLGVLCGLGAATLGVLAVTDQLSWLSSRTDEVTRLHDWIDARLPLIRRW